MPKQDENTKPGSAATTYPNTNTGNRGGSPGANPTSDQNRTKSDQKPGSMSDDKTRSATGDDEDVDEAKDTNSINKGAGEWSGHNRTVGQGGNAGDSKGRDQGAGQSGSSEGKQSSGSGRE